MIKHERERTSQVSLRRKFRFQHPHFYWRAKLMQLGYTYLKNLRKSLPLVDYGQKSLRPLEVENESYPILLLASSIN